MSAVRCGYGRLSGLALAACRRSCLSEGRMLQAPSSVNITPVATLKATYGEKYPYETPFPYEKKKFGVYETLFENTTPRLNENSKIIVVDGNIAVGKTEFAKRLAKGFDMKFFPATSDSRCFLNKEYGYDVRGLDSLLPPGAQSYDLAKFYAEKHPEKGTVGRLRLAWYEEKFYDYVAAMKHLLSTGQGVVLVRSVYSDIVFVEALRSMGWLTKNFVNYYYDYRANSICELFKPHLTIYLDAPTNIIRERITKRNNPREVNSKILSDEYLSTIAKVYQNKFLPQARQHGEVVEVEWSQVADNTDMDVIIEELQLLKLESDDLDDPKFDDWNRNEEDDYMKMRLFLDNNSLLNGLFMRPFPWNAPEAMLSQDESAAVAKLRSEHPIFKNAPGWSPELGHSTLLKF